MKVELDLSTEQLVKLDENLTNLLENLTEEQKLEILKAYIINQLNNLYEESTRTWGGTEVNLTKLGKEIVEGLQEKIQETVSSDILNNVELQKIIDMEKQKTIKELPNIYAQAISKYITDNLFKSQYEIEQNVRNIIWNMRG